MTIEVTPKQLKSAGLWDKFCFVLHITRHVADEFYDDDAVSLTIEQAQEIGISVATTILSEKENK